MNGVEKGSSLYASIPPSSVKRARRWRNTIWRYIYRGVYSVCMCNIMCEYILLWYMNVINTIYDRFSICIIYYHIYARMYDTVIYT